MFFLFFSALLAFYEVGSMHVEVPDQAISEHSLITTIPEKERFADWTAEDHSNSYIALQKIVRCWKQQQVADQFFVYGKVADASHFQWEVVPHFTCSSSFMRCRQLFWRLWGVAFPKDRLHERERGEKARQYKKLFADLTESVDPCDESALDAFCNAAVIERQWVYQGELVNVLYDYRPIGYGGEKMHFLFTPKQHRPTFYELTQEEYQEALLFAQKIVQHFSHTRPIQEAHLYHKSGKDAGQTVPHWHLHLLLTTSNFQDCLGRLDILRKMLLRPKPLSNEKLQGEVAKYRDEIIPILRYE